MEWEQIDSYTQRAKVFGGWIVKTYEEAYTNMHPNEIAQGGIEWRLSTCFVPDKFYDWKLKK